MLIIFAALFGPAQVHVFPVQWTEHSTPAAVKRVE